MNLDSYSEFGFMWPIDPSKPDEVHRQQERLLQAKENSSERRNEVCRLQEAVETTYNVRFPKDVDFYSSDEDEE